MGKKKEKLLGIPPFSGSCRMDGRDGMELKEMAIRYSTKKRPELLVAQSAVL